MAASPAAGNPEYEEKTQVQISAFEQTSWYHSIELPDSTIVPGLVGIDDLRARLESFPLPRDLGGKRVLDVGAATGWNSFEAERRGAEVLAVDCVDFQEFRVAREKLGSKVKYAILDWTS